MNEEIKLTNGKKSVIVRDNGIGRPIWLFCENGYQTTGVEMSKEVFEMMRELTTNPDVVELYEQGEI